MSETQNYNFTTFECDEIIAALDERVWMLIGKRDRASANDDQIMRDECVRKIGIIKATRAVLLAAA